MHMEGFIEIGEVMTGYLGRVEVGDPMVAEEGSVGS
jgi:hypothetical protein